MATVNLTKSSVSLGFTDIVSWAALANGDVGAPLDTGDFADRTVQVLGTFGSGGQVTIQGSLDGSNWFTLSNPTGNALVFTSAGGKGVLEMVRYLRPNITAGDGTTSITVLLLTKRA